MSFDTFDEGITLGGIRSKTEVRILICYLFTCIKQPMSKTTVINALLEKGLTNYFEASSCFDDLVSKGNLINSEDDSDLFIASENARMISEQLGDNLALTIKERAVECVMSLLEKERREKENKVTIENVDNGYIIKCSVSGEKTDLMNISLFLADDEQARIVKKNFYKNPQLIYKTILATLTRNNTLIKETLEDLSGVN